MILETSETTKRSVLYTPGGFGTEPQLKTAIISILMIVIVTKPMFMSV